MKASGHVEVESHCRGRAKYKPLALLAAMLAASILAGCGQTSMSVGAKVTSATGCLPSPLQVRPTRSRAGSTVTLSSAPFRCAASYPRGKTYGLTLGQVGRAKPLALGTVRVRPNGAFSANVHIPADASPGESYISVTGSALDRCGNTLGRSCAGYVAPPLTVLAPR